MVKGKKKEISTLTKLKVQGFKCFKDAVEIEIRPFTILAGANSGGKTSIMQSVLLLKQTMLSSIGSPYPLVIDGESASFTDYKQMFWKFGKDIEINRLFIGLKNNLNIELEYEFVISEEEFSIKRIHLTVEDYKTRLEFKEKDGKLTVAQPIGFDDLKRIETRTNKARWSLQEFLNEVHGGDIFKLVNEYVGPTSMRHMGPIFSFFPQISRIFHIPGVRNRPERTYPRTQTIGEFAGHFHHYTASLIADWSNGGSKGKKTKLAQLGRDLKKLGLGSLIRSKQLDSVSISLFTDMLPEGRNEIPIWVNIADVGQGVSQVIPVLTALIEAKPGEIVYIEQPELHLHPRAQVILPEIIARASKRGVRVIIETHSAMFLLGMRRIVTKGKINPELIRLHWFTRNKKTGIASVRSGDMDSKGSIGNWPEDFSDVSMKFEDEYLKHALQ